MMTVPLQLRPPKVAEPAFRPRAARLKTPSLKARLCPLPSSGLLFQQMRVCFFQS